MESSVHTIVGVPSSIAAFVGTAPRGPDSQAAAIGSLMEYERVFGGANASPLGVAMCLFFQNGGSQAGGVRVAPALDTKASLSLPKQAGSKVSPTLMAASKGIWGAKLAARADDDAPADGKTTYNLTPRDTATGRTEKYPSVSTDPASSRSLARLLKTQAVAQWRRAHF